MSAEGLLSNPSLFAGPNPPFIGQESDQLIKLFIETPGGGSISSIKAHLFRIWAPGLCRHRKFREKAEFLDCVFQTRFSNDERQARLSVRYGRIS